MRATERGIISLPIYLITILFAFASSVASVTLNGNPREVRGGQTQADAHVSGHVYRADTGAPMAGAVVTLSPCFVAGMMWTLTATIAADGGYTVSGRPFCYQASASSPGFVPQGYGLDLHPLVGIPFDLKPGDKVEI
jgi:hypothetical protein